MSNISLISLNTLMSWDMRQFTNQAPRVDHWNPESELVPIGTFASSRLGNGYSIEKISCISPADVVSQSVSINASNKIFTQLYFDWLTEDIKAGDLLISRVGVIFVDESMQTLVFSNEFVLLRPFNKSDGLSLWAILNSTPGKNSLADYFNSNRSFETSSVVRSRDFLKDFLIPKIELDNKSINEIKTLINQIPHNIENLIDRPTSWMGVKKLNLGEDWFRAIHSIGLVTANGGKKLEDLIDTVVVGRSIRNAETDNSKNFVPFVTPKYVVHGRKTDLRQVLGDDSNSSFSKPGDLIIATTSKKAYFYVNDIDSILGTGVVAIRPKPGITAEKLASIFASASVQLDLNYLLSRGVVGHLSKSDLMNLAVPFDWDSENQDHGNVLLVRAQLDALLWN